MWFANNWKELLGAAIVIGLCIALYFAKNAGYKQCTADNVAAANVNLLASQKAGITAMDDNMLKVSTAMVQKQSITQTIGKSHAQNDDSPPPAVIQSAINGLYGSAQR